MVIGCVDIISREFVSGWAINEANPEVKPTIQVCTRGKEIAKVHATLLREDVLSVGHSTALCGFHINLRECHIDLDDIEIYAFVESSLVSPTKGILFRVDQVSVERLCGWASFKEQNNRFVFVEAFHEAVCLGKTTCHHAREDVRDAGYSLSGDSGFEFEFMPGTLKEGDLVKLRFFGSNEDCPSYEETCLIPPPKVLGNVDRLSRYAISGWACLEGSERPVDLSIFVNGNLLEEVKADVYRPDLEDHLHNEGRNGFYYSFPTPLSEGDRLVLKESKDNRHLAFSYDSKVGENSLYRQYHDFFVERREDVIRRFNRKMFHNPALEGVTIIMSVYQPKLEWLREAIESVLSQWFERWELVCIDDKSDSSDISGLLSSYATSDLRIRVLSNKDNLGVSRSTNIGIKEAKYNLIAFMDHDDCLTPNALYHVSRTFRDKSVDISYSDEIITGKDINDFRELRARPQFSYYYYLSHPYFVHLVAVRKALAQSVGALNNHLEVSQDVDFVLRALTSARGVAHIPLPLYRWRTHQTSLGHMKKGQVTSSTIQSLGSHFQRLTSSATARDGLNFNEYIVDWPLVEGKVLVIIPSFDNTRMLEKCLTSLNETCVGEDIRVVVVDHRSQTEGFAQLLARSRELFKEFEVIRYEGVFNFSKMNNQAFDRFSDGCKFACFVNDDIEFRSSGWLRRLKSLAALPDVGIVGPKLLYPDGRIQHAGVVIGLNGVAEHVGKFTKAAIGSQVKPGFNSVLSTCREYSAVTGALMLLQSMIFREVDGFDDRLGNAFNDIDLCLRVGRTGLKVLYDGLTVMTHHESATRSLIPDMLRHPDDTRFFADRWQDILRSGDPYYNLALQHRGEDHTPANDMKHLIVEPRVCLLSSRMNSFRSAGL